MTRRVLGHDPGDAPRALRERIGVVLQQSELTFRSSPCARSIALFAGYYASPRDLDEVIELVGLDGEARRTRQDAVGGPEATARPRHRARRRPRSRLPRRADDGVRPRSATLGLGDDPLAALAREDDPADDALPRRGAATRRPGRRPPGRQDRDARGRRRADRRDAANTEIRYRRDGERVVVETDEPTRVLHELTAEALAAGRELERLEVAPPDARGRLPRARRRGGRGRE